MWQEIIEKDNYSMQRTFPCGTDVILTISFTQNSYEIYSSVESRTSGPNNSLITKVNTKEKAMRILKNEITLFEKDFL